MADAQIEAVNRALSKLAKAQITSLTEDSYEAVEAKLHADHLLTEMAEWCDWPVLTKRVILAEVTNDRAAEWNYAYGVPSDMSAPIAVRESEEDADTLPRYVSPYTLPAQDAHPVRFIIEGGVIYTNVKTATLVYKRDNLTAAELDPLMRKAYSDELAARMCMGLTKNERLTAKLEEAAFVSKNIAIANAENKTQRIAPEYTSEAELARMGVVE